MLRYWASLALLLSFSTVSWISDEGIQPPPSLAGSAETPPERAVLALFTWADVDGDGRLELAAVSEGGLRLLTDAGGGRFEDATARFGLGGVENAALALWVDYDADGKLDLFIGARTGASRLFHNEGVFVDMTAASGLASEGAVQSAQWFDRDGDGRLDLFLVTAEESELFRGLEGGFFERAELPGLRGVPVVALGSSSVALPGVGVPQPSGDGKNGDDAGGLLQHFASARPSGGLLPVGPTPSIGSVTPIVSFPSGCATSIRDLATPGSCLQSSTTPTLGLLYPLSSNLFVAMSGDVGIGTTSPAARLDVAGTARIRDTLTLAPSGDTALDVSTGSIYKGGALFLHTKGGLDNTAVGNGALRSVTTGAINTASGAFALRNNTSGFLNTASGAFALQYNTTGSRNTAVGASALRNNTSGIRNTADGYSALFYNTTGTDNTASGAFALSVNRTGIKNTASGASALEFNSTGSHNTASGTEALRNNTTGLQNTAIGYRALYASNANDNTAVGHHALSSNTSGYFNTASGAFALDYNTTGSYNTASGTKALRHNTTGLRNTAIGYRALHASNANDNTAVGHRSLSSNTSGFRNTAIGYEALDANTTGSKNTASGDRALLANTTGSRNTASGQQALTSNTTGIDNTASGYQSLFNNTTGNGNIALGKAAGSSLTTGDDNIDIGNTGVAAEGATIRIGSSGTHTRAFIAGIHGVSVTGTSAVLINSSGQLGTVVSSRRFKEEIRDMGEATERLLELRPVVFRYKPEVQSGERPLEYGLIAEEVAEIFPDLVVYDEEGQPFTVKYHLLSAMLLNEMKKQADEVNELRNELEQQRSRLSALEARTSTAPTATLPAAPSEANH